MPEIVGKPIFQYFDKPQSISIANKTFHNVEMSDTRNYMQDNKLHSINYLTTDRAEYSVYETDGKIKRVIAEYHKPIERKFGDRVFKNIISSSTDENGIKTYENITPNFLRTIISVDKTGKLLELKEPIEVRMINKVKKILGKFIK